jgi:hypothetical protein
MIAMKKKEYGFMAEKRKKFRQKFPVISDRDLRFKEGFELEMIQSVGLKLGKTNQELLRIIIEL